VHQTAEVIEHLLTPEIADEMRRELGLCESFDPKSEIHQRSA
jgi:Mn-dependent DtxR family transcriptional regulator